MIIDMNTILKKGVTHLSITYSNSDYSNNLYCSDFILKASAISILEMNFTKIVNSKFNTNSNDDLNDLIKNIELLESIHINDSRISKSLIRRLKHGENVMLRLIIDKSYDLASTIKFKNDDNEFIIKISSR
jgi:hypothetical protein